MKAQAFLELVGKMMAAQQDYFAAKRNGDPKAKDLLFRSKGIEKAVMNVVKEGWLEADDPTPAPPQMGTFGEGVNTLDLFGNPLPTDGKE